MTKAGRRTMLAALAKEHQDSDLAVKMACSTHAIQYYQPNGSLNQCPMCDADKRIASLQQSLATTTKRLDHLEQLSSRLQVQVDIASAIRDSLDLVDVDDLTFLKMVIYQWRADRSISMKVIHSAPPRKRGKAKQRPVVSGFLAVPRVGEPEAHPCTSVGGLAIAGYYEEAMNTVGGAQAMTLLIRGMGPVLTGEMP